MLHTEADPQSLKKRILIVGGGIAGVTLASLLQNSNFDITLVERAPTWRTIGYVIGFWSNGLAMLKKLDLGDEFWKKTYLIRKSSIVHPNSKIVYTLSANKVSVGEIARTSEREILHNALNKKLTDRVRVIFNTDIVDIDDSGEKVAVDFSNGTKETFDIVVGADGMRSTVRKKVFGENYLRPYGWRVHVF